jgi:hypothetical protein
VVFLIKTESGKNVQWREEEFRLLSVGGDPTEHMPTFPPLSWIPSVGQSGYWESASVTRVGGVNGEPNRTPETYL